MRPPECVICGNDFDPNGKGGMIYFKKRFSDRVWERKMNRIEGVGHPPNVEWFCEKHYPAAEKLQDKTIDKVMKELREQFKK